MGRCSEFPRTWGTTPEERQVHFPCDEILPDYNESYYRGISVRAEAAVLFRWLCQMRAAPYSYDWIDNFGRSSPSELTPGLDCLALGQPFMTIFDLVEFEQGVHITLRLRKPGLFPASAVSYRIVAVAPSRCRLIVKLVLRFRPGPLDGLSRRLAPWLDWIMMRRQMLNLKALSERSAVHAGSCDSRLP